MTAGISPITRGWELTFTCSTSDRNSIAEMRRCLCCADDRRLMTDADRRRGDAAPPSITPIGYHEGRPPCLPRRKLPRAAPSPSDKLIATNPSIERKGDANPYTSLNGNMFTLLH